MKTIKLLAIALIALFTFSCSSDDDNKIVAPQAKLVKKEVSVQNSGSTNTTTYTYDALGRLQKKAATDEEITYTRNPAGKIVQALIVSTGADRIVTYFYDNQARLIKTEKKLGSTLEEKRTFTYYIDRYVEQYYDIDGSNVWEYVYYYSADKKNIASRKRNYGGGNGPFDEITYTYDNKVGLEKIAPYSEVPKPFYNTNNVEQFSNADPLGNVYFTVNYTFTYDLLGFPLTSTDSNNTTITYTY